ncbi:energy transducer TonB [Dyadobacter sp. 32]|uniref:energy transducer TonB n=1 Tax=Dyadobacter sp. 32 TaxID=538966 RepID=UPI0011ED6889
MKRLHENRIELLKKYLQAAKVSPELLPEILDHLSCEAEERLWDGNTFEQAYKGIIETADHETLLDLNAETRYLLAMEKSLNDIVFEGRNKLYGAYALRKGYKQTMQRAMLLGVSIFMLMIMLPDLYARLVPEKKAKDIAYTVEVMPIDIRPEKKQPKPLPQQPPLPAARTVKNVVFNVLPDEIVEVDFTPPVAEEFIDASPGQNTSEGVDGMGLVAEPVAAVEPLVVNPVNVKQEPEEVTFAEESPQYVGGMDGMLSFLQKNLHYPAQATRMGIQGRVFIQFTVGSDGRIENVKSVKGIGFGCDEEAERVVKLMPPWKPGKQSGKPVRVKYTLPISFQLNRLN